MDRKVLRAQSLYGGPKQAILHTVHSKIMPAQNHTKLICNAFFVSYISYMNDCSEQKGTQATLHYLCGLPLAILLL